MTYVWSVAVFLFSRPWRSAGNGAWLRARLKPALFDVHRVKILVRQVKKNTV